MRFLSFIHEGRASFGAIVDSGIVDLGARNRNFSDLRDAIRANQLDALARVAERSEPDLQLQEVAYLPTIPNPEKIICIGVNYANRNAEYKDGTEAPKYPSVFMRNRDSLVGHEQPLMEPPESDQLDYEREIVIVIGRYTPSYESTHKEVYMIHYLKILLNVLH